MSRSDMYYRELHPKHIDPTFLDASRDLADAMALTAQMAADWATEYKRYQNPKTYVLDDGEQVAPKDAEKELKALNIALKRYIEANGDVVVEGVGTLTLQHPASERVDLISLHQHAPETFFRLLQLGCLEVNAAALKAQEKAGMVADQIPKMPVASTPRLVWSKQ